MAKPVATAFILSALALVSISAFMTTDGFAHRSGCNSAYGVDDCKIASR